MNALELAGVSYSYPSSPAPALRELTLEIAQGEFVVLAGKDTAIVEERIKTLPDDLVDEGAFP